MPSAVFPEISGGSRWEPSFGRVVRPHPRGVHEQLRVEGAEISAGVRGVHHAFARWSVAHGTPQRPPKIRIGALGGIWLCLCQEHGQPFFVHGVDPSEGHQCSRSSGLGFVVRFPSKADVARGEPGNLIGQDKFGPVRRQQQVDDSVIDEPTKA